MKEEAELEPSTPPQPPPPTPASALPEDSCVGLSLLPDVNIAGILREMLGYRIAWQKPLSLKISLKPMSLHVLPRL